MLRYEFASKCIDNMCRFNVIFSWSIFAFDVFAIWTFTVQDHIYGRSNFGHRFCLMALWILGETAHILYCTN